MYNKSKIMTIAWAQYKHGNYNTFSEALKYAWYNAKNEIAITESNRANGIIMVDELIIGDMVTIEYGDYNNYVTCTIIGIRRDGICDKNWYLFNAESKDIKNIEFCLNDGEMIRKIEASEAKKAA